MSSTLLKMVNQSFNKKLTDEIKFTKGNMYEPENIWKFPNGGDFRCLLFEMARKKSPKGKISNANRDKPIFK